MGTEGEFSGWTSASCNSLQVLESVWCHTNLHVELHRLLQTVTELYSNYNRRVSYYSVKCFPQLPAKQTGCEPEFS